MNFFKCWRWHLPAFQKCCCRIVVVDVDVSEICNSFLAYFRSRQNGIKRRKKYRFHFNRTLLQLPILMCVSIKNERNDIHCAFTSIADQIHGSICTKVSRFAFIYFFILYFVNWFFSTKEKTNWKNMKWKWTAAAKYSMAKKNVWGK